MLEGVVGVVEGSKRVAVLIDGDNFSAELADRLFADVEVLGNAIVRRVYGGSTAMANWREQARRHGIALRECATGKNAADMHLAIDAMDIVHRGRVQLFCIVSSDSDFTPLVRRLREDGVTVNGYGDSKATVAFRDACDSFLALKKQAPIEPAEKPIAAKPKASPAASKSARQAAPVKPAVQPGTLTQLPTIVKASDRANEERVRILLLKAFEHLAGAEWYPLSTLLGEVKKLQPEFTAKAFGASKPVTLVRRTQCFDDELQGGTMMVRRRPVKAVLATFVTRAA